MIQILLATYNGEKYLVELLDSILSQTDKNWTLLVHDDGSTDNTLNILLAYQAKFPLLINILDDGIKFDSPRDNFLHLLALSNAAYVMFCDQDDIWLPEKIEKTFNKMKQLELIHPNNAVIVHTDLTVVDEKLVSVAPSMFEYQGLDKNIRSLLQILAKNSITGCTMMINKKAIEVSIPIMSVAIMHDWWIAASVVKNQGKIGFIDEPLILYRQHSYNSVGAKKKSIFGLMSVIFNHVFDRETRIKTWLQAKEIDPSLNYFIFFGKKLSITLKHLMKS